MTDPDSAQTQKAPVAVVTGAARGLGRALVTELCARGVRVAGIGRSASSLAPVTEALADQTFLPVVADMADVDAVADAFGQVDAAFGPAEILINNAAVFPHRDILDETPGSFMDTLAINLGGPVAASHEALRRMVKTGEGRIITVTSYAGRRPAPMSAAYAVSKEAARAFHRALYADLGDRFPGIILTDWIPGALNTEMGISNGLDPAQVARWGAALALSRDRSLNGVIFAENREELPEQSLKRRLFEKVTGRARQPRVMPG